MTLRKALKQGKRLRAKPKPKLTPEQRERREAWFKAVTKGKSCVVCGRRTRLQGHHVAEQQVLERRAKDYGLDPEKVVWHPDAGMPVCVDDHEAHTNGSRRINVSDVPGNCVAYLAALNLTWVLVRKYLPR